MIDKKQGLFVFDLIAIMVFALGLVLSKFMVNLGMVLFATRVILSGRQKIREGFERSKWMILVLVSFYLLNVLGSLWSEDIRYLLYDLNKKLPLLIVPISIGLISPLDKRVIRLGYTAYILALLAGVGIGTYNYIIQENPNTRSLIHSLSHIRFALNLSFGILSLSYFYIKSMLYSKRFYRQAIPLVLAWFLLYMFVSQSFTGLFILFSFLVLYIPYYIYKHKKGYKSILILSSYSLVIIGSVFYIKKQYDNFFTPNPIYSEIEAGPRGENRCIENGNYIYDHIYIEEIMGAWEDRTGLSAFASLDSNNTEIAYVDILVRYMNSIHPIKDSLRFAQLTDSDIHNIKAGISNRVYMEKFSIRPRLYRLFYQIEVFNKLGRVGGFSEIQRIELWKNSFSIIKDNPIMGIGTGDIAKEFEERLEARGSELSGSGLRAHNQYLTVWICFGLIGFLVFMFWLIYPGIRTGLFSSFLYIAFFYISVVSMLNEDTLDNLLGIMFFIFIQSIFVFNSDIILGRLEGDENK